jgi:hypothetical protein
MRFNRESNPEKSHHDIVRQSSHEIRGGCVRGYKVSSPEPATHHDLVLGAGDGVGGVNDESILRVDNLLNQDRHLEGAVGHAGRVAGVGGALAPL